MKRRIVRHVSLAACFVAMFAATPTWAGIQPTPFRTGLFGITAGQAIRVSVLNAGDDGGVVAPCFEPGSLVPVVRILDVAGAVRFERRGQPIPDDGRGAFVDFIPVPNDGIPAPTGAQTPGASLLLALAQNRRLQVRAEVELIDEHGQKVQRNDVILTLEVYQIATGRTAFTVPFAAVAFNPQPEPPTPAQPVGQ